MGSGRDLGETFVFGRYIHDRILPLAPRRESIPFRGLVDNDEEPLATFEDLEADILSRPGTLWSLTGPPPVARGFFFVESLTHPFRAS